MAINVLTAVAMSAEAERIFSGARRTIPFSRMSLEGPMIEMLACIKSWIITGIIDDSFTTDASDDEVPIRGTT